MKKKIAILGSTGSIGKTTFDILRKDKKNFDLILLTTNNNHKEILKQTKEFKVKNLVINNKKHYANLKIKKLIFITILIHSIKNFIPKLITLCVLFQDLLD